MQERISGVIEGMSPLLMARFPMEPIEGLQKMTSEQQAEISAYRQPKTNELYVPGVALWSCLINGATFIKGKGRASLQKVAAACLLLEPEYLLLGTKEYTIDSRRVVNPTTRGAIISHRPRLENWKLSFNLDYDTTLLSRAEVRQIVDAAGQRVGLLSFRPACKGPFGRFQVVEWK